MKFLADFNPSAQIGAAKNPDRAFFGNAPTLAIMNKSYGEGYAATWLLPQIFDLVAYSNSNGTLKEQQAEFLAEAIANEYYYLKASELLLFFYRFKLGKYGQFYGSVDPMKVTKALEEFCKERNDVLDRKEKEQKQAERERWAAEAVTPQEYCRLRGYPEFDSVLDVIAHTRKLEQERENASSAERKSAENQ